MKAKQIKIKSKKKYGHELVPPHVPIDSLSDTNLLDPKTHLFLFDVCKHSFSPWDSAMLLET